jgi:hypothetical protein
LRQCERGGRRSAQFGFLRGEHVSARVERRKPVRASGVRMRLEWAWSSRFFEAYRCVANGFACCIEDMTLDGSLCRVLRSRLLRAGRDRREQTRDCEDRTPEIPAGSGFRGRLRFVRTIHDGINCVICGFYPVSSQLVGN